MYNMEALPEFKFHYMFRCKIFNADRKKHVPIANVRGPNTMLFKSIVNLIFVSFFTFRFVSFNTQPGLLYVHALLPHIILRCVPSVILMNGRVNTAYYELSVSHGTAMFIS